MDDWRPNLLLQCSLKTKDTCIQCRSPYMREQNTTPHESVKRDISIIRMTTRIYHLHVFVAIAVELVTTVFDITKNTARIYHLHVFVAIVVELVTTVFDSTKTAFL